MTSQSERPNVVLMLADDLGFSDIGCYGGEIDTPNLDNLAAEGHRTARFYNTARCSPSRASLLTGLHPHQAGIGILTKDDRPAGYPGTINDRCVTLAEILVDHGYRTHMSGKWHLAQQRMPPHANWPTRRGFQTFYGTVTGCGSYFDPQTLSRNEELVDDAQDPGFYYTDAIGSDAARFICEHDPATPFLLYVAFTAPHWPLHAKEVDIERYRGRFDPGWDVLRQERLSRQKTLGVVPNSAELSPRDAEVPAWADEPERDWQATRMEAYAAQVDSLDQNIGKVMAALDQTSRRDNTIVVFLSDNGASAEELPIGDPEAFAAWGEAVPRATRDGRPMLVGNKPSIKPGPEDTYASYGVGWANLSNTPYRLYKRFVHEGGIASPFIVRWPGGGLQTGAVSTLPVQLVDVVPTVLEATGVPYPRSRAGRDVVPAPGRSFLGALRGEALEPRPLYWEHMGNCAIRVDNWKLVRLAGEEWELYDVIADPAELNDIAAEHPGVVGSLAEQWAEWAQGAGVKPWQGIVDQYVAHGLSELDAHGS